MIQFSALSNPKWFRRLRNALLVLVGLIALYAVAGFFIAPPIVRSQIETALAGELGRSVKLGRVEFNPFTLRARLTDFELADRDAARMLLKFAALDLDVSTASLWRWAPVLDAVRLERPQLDIARNADGTWSIQDLIDRALGGPAGPTPQFSVNNIEVENGSFLFDDRPNDRKLTIADIGIGIPFLSSLPYDARIRVTPRLAGVFDGARFALAGSSSSPFADVHEADVELNLDALPLPKYAAYAPLPQELKLRDGALTTRLKLVFVTEKGTPRTITLSGTARLDNLNVARKDDSLLMAAKTIDASLGSVDALKRTIAVQRIAIDAPELDLKRSADGTLEFARLMETHTAPGKDTAPGKGTRAKDAASGQNTAAAKDVSAAKPAQPSAPPAAPWSFTIADASIANGVLHVADEAVSPAFKVNLANVAFSGKDIASTGGKSVAEASFDADDGARFKMRVEGDLAGATARGHFEAATFHLAKLYPYYASALNLDIRSGTLDIAGDFDWAGGQTPRLVLAETRGTLKDVETAIRGEREALWRFAQGEVDGVGFDLAKRAITINRAEVGKGSLRIVRQSDGTVNFERLLRTDETPAGIAGTKATSARPVSNTPRSDAVTSDAKPAGTPKAGSTPGGASPGGDGWNMVIRKILFDNIDADFEDQTPQPAVKLKLLGSRISIENFSNAPGNKSTFEANTRVGSKGRLALAGSMARDPFAADWKVDAAGIDLAPLRPYFESRTNVVVTGGSATTKGRLTLVTTAFGTPRIGYTGDVTVSDLNSLDRPTSQELARWKTLALTGVDFASEPFKLAVGAVALDQFFARVILNADATLNIQQLLAPQSPAVAAAQATTPTTESGVTTRELPATRSDDLPVSIGLIRVSNGDVAYTDLFVRPNYSTHLTQVAGSVSALSATQAGTVEASGRVEGTAPVDVRGTLNPFAKELQLDLTAKASDIDLPPLTPYSQKYAGYGIQKGKLSVEVHYRIEDRKLAASNVIKLDQLTFGDRVESPTATKLPVLLAVSLLKDRNGVINLDLPIQGTLDDPQFSIWGVLVQIFVNLITKAVTAPFALLAALAGGGGEQLAYVEFAPGRADLSDAAQVKLRTLAKALTDRPALKLDIGGRAVPDSDRDGIKRVMLDRALRIQKQKELAAQGESAPALDALAIDAAEYPKLLAAVYGSTELPNKPRNALGIVRTIPPAEMEPLLLESYRVDDEALHDLANRRSQTVKEWLAGGGTIAADRMFVVASKTTAEGITDKGAPTRVDFSIR